MGSNERNIPVIGSWTLVFFFFEVKKTQNEQTNVEKNEPVEEEAEEDATKGIQEEEEEDATKGIQEEENTPKEEVTPVPFNITTTVLTNDTEPVNQTSVMGDEDDESSTNSIMDEIHSSNLLPGASFPIFFSVTDR